jgi:hypothetical protein
MSVKGAQRRPARMGGRIEQDGIFEAVDFAKERDRRRKANRQAKASRRKNRH